MRTIEWHHENIERQRKRIIAAGGNPSPTQQAIVSSAREEIGRSEQEIARMVEEVADRR